MKRSSLIGLIGIFMAGLWSTCCNASGAGAEPTMDSESETESTLARSTDSGGDTSDTASDDTATDMNSSDSDAVPRINCSSLIVGGSLYGTHVLRFESEDGTAVYLQRSFVDWGIGESVEYDLDTMVIAEPGKCTVIGNDTLLEYGNSHHNWNDFARGVADGVRYEVAMSYSFADGLSTGWEFPFTVFDERTSQQIGETLALTPTGGPQRAPWYPRIIISEFMVSGSAHFTDEAGEMEPWIELSNWGTDDYDLSGYYLSNDPAKPKLWAIPDGTTINRHEYLVIVADGQPAQGPLHTSFRFASESGSVRFSTPGGVSAGERAYGPPTDGISLQIDPASDMPVPATLPTPGAENQ